ncbi:hypothetical protein DIRU0_E28656 [Diutina rugosa]
MASSFHYLRRSCYTLSFHRVTLVSNSSNDNGKTSTGLSQTHGGGKHDSVSSQMVEFFGERTTISNMSTNERQNPSNAIIDDIPKDTQAQHDSYDHWERHGNLFSP